ncbi:MAG TPA: hypothetical protein VKV20_16070 [Ktedonobacteraceae bacterium]|jgi:hypothetical protein|nr:hypothetical protein [Ktedonobacteraceae bacterium]
MGILAVVLLVLLAFYFLLCVFLALRLHQTSRPETFPFYHQSRMTRSELLALERQREKSLEEMSLQALQTAYYGYLLSSPAGQIETSFSHALFKGKDVTINRPLDAKKQEEIAAWAAASVPNREQLARCGFTADEIDELFHLQKWYQTGGSDRIMVMRHWEFLRFLVRNGKLEV